MSEKLEIKLKGQKISDNELLGNMRKVAEKLNKDTLSRNDYESYGEFSYTTIRRRFGSWYTALDKAGLKSTQIRINNSVEAILENIYDVWCKLGRQPSYRDMYDKEISKYGPGTYEGRFGSWNKSLEAFEEYINNEDFEKSTSKPQKKTQSKRTSRKIGWKLRAQILIKDNCICKMCGASPSKDPSVMLHVDHIVPWSKDGETTPENLQTLCSKCNIGKSDMM